MQKRIVFVANVCSVLIISLVRYFSFKNRFHRLSVCYFVFPENFTAIALLSLGTAFGDEVTVEARGPDGQAALAAILALLASDMGESGASAAPASGQARLVAGSFSHRSASTARSATPPDPPRHFRTFVLSYFRTFVLSYFRTFVL